MLENPTKKENSRAHGNLRITRLDPVDQQLTINYEGETREPGEVAARIYDANLQLITIQKDIAKSGSLCIPELQNHIDYFIEVIQFDTDGKEAAKSRMRLFRTGYIPGKVVNYIHPEDYTFMPSGRSPASPSLLRLPNGSLLASHDVYWGEADQNLTLVFLSQDDGKNWSFQSQIYPSFWTKLFSNVS